MNFNKDYPIAILDTNIVMEVPNILDILKGCNIVIPYTLIDELDNHKKENKGARDFVNNFLALSEKVNLSKDGYKLENDCMLYLDIDKNNSYHKDINLDSKKQDIKFIAEAKNIKEKYNDMEVVLISSDKIMKITASIFDVKVKFLEEFIFENKNIEGLYKLYKSYNNIEVYKKIFEILSENKDIDGLFKLSESYNSRGVYEVYYEVYKKIFEILSENKDIDGLYKLSEIYNPDKKIYEKISNILVENKDIDGLYKLSEIYNPYKIYEEIYNILAENKDIDGLYKLSESYNPNKEIYEEIYNILAENKDTEELYKLAGNISKLVNKPKEEIYEVYKNYKVGYHHYYNGYEKEETIRKIKIDIKIDILENIYNKIFTILAENKDAKGLVELLKNGGEFEWFVDDKKYNSVELICETISRIFNTLLESKNVSKLLELAEVENNYIKNNQNNYRNNNIIINFKREISEIYKKSFEILSDNKDIDGLYKLFEIYKYKEIYKEISNILAENKDIDGLYKLSESYNPNEEIYNKISNILAENKDIDGLYKLSEIYDSEEIYEKIFEILSEAEDLEGLFKLSEIYDSEEIYEKICEILDKEEDKNKLYELTKNKDIKNLLSNSSHPKINEIMLKMLIDKIEELEN